MSAHSLFNHVLLSATKALLANGFNMDNADLSMKTVSKRVRGEFLAVLHAWTGCVR